MDWSNIICIEVKKYNNQQLDVICEQLNLQPGTLAVFKESGSTLLYWEKDKSYVIGSVKKETLRDGFSKPLYKGLFLNSNYNHLSQKEKDRLLKIRPTEFRTKSTKRLVDSLEVLSQNVPTQSKLVKSIRDEFEVLEIDAILDKIFKFGIESMTSNEKRFLDNLSKS